MSAMKLMMRGAAVLAMLAVAAPALPCGDAKQTTATKDAPAASKDSVASKTPADKAAAKTASTKTKTKTTATN